MLFFIDSFERAFDRAGILSPVPIFSLPGREDRTDEGDEREGEQEKNGPDDGENGENALRDQGRR